MLMLQCTGVHKHCTDHMWGLN